MSYPINLNLIQKRLYEKERSFTDFSNISETLTNIKEKKDTFLKKIVSNEEGLDLYIKTLEFLTAPSIHNHLTTYDEKIAFLIETLDPSLEMYKEYVRTPIISLEKIESANPKDQKSLSEKRKQQIQSFIKSIRSKFGFYDSKLLKYESIYAIKVKNSAKFLSNISKNFIRQLMVHASKVKDFESISDNSYKKIIEKAEYYISLSESSNNANDLAYNLVTLNPLLHFRSIEEVFALFIAIIDPDLNLLKIYEEESIINKIKQRAQEEIGFFDAELIRLEKAYHNRFTPNKKLSIWSL